MTSVKTAISLPEDVFASLVAIAEATGKSRSAVVAEAVEELARRRDADEITLSYNEVWGSMTAEGVEAELKWSHTAASHAARRWEEEDGGWGRVIPGAGESVP